MNVEFIFIPDIETKLSDVEISSTDAFSINNVIFSVPFFTPFNNVVYTITTKALPIGGTKNNVAVII